MNSSGIRSRTRPIKPRRNLSPILLCCTENASPHAAGTPHYEHQDTPVVFSTDSPQKLSRIAEFRIGKLQLKVQSRDAEILQLKREICRLQEQIQQQQPRSVRFDLLENAEIRRLQQRNSELSLRLNQSEASQNSEANQGRGDKDIKLATYYRLQYQRVKRQNEQLAAQLEELGGQVAGLNAQLERSAQNEQELRDVIIEISRMGQ